jgi:hypothetical protein
MGSTVTAPKFLSSSTKAVLVLLGELASGADDLIDQRRKYGATS